MGVSESWFYKWCNHPPTATEQRRDLLDEAVGQVFEEHDGEYGSPRVHAELIEQPEWESLSVNTVAERMAAPGFARSPQETSKEFDQAGPEGV